MTKIQIRKVNGVPMGRPKNPYPKNPYPYISEGAEYIKWYDFEQSVTEHEALGCEEGEAEANLVAIPGYSGYTTKGKRLGLDTEYVWIVPTPEKTEVKPDIIKRLEKVEQTVAELASLTNKLAIAVRKRFEATH